MNEIELNVNDFRRQLLALAERHGIEVRDVIFYGVMKPWSQNLCRWTWPLSKKEGTDAIEYDLRRVFRVSSRMQKAPATDPATFHKDARDPSTGRVRRSYKTGGPRRLTVRQSDFDARFRHVAARVGLLKAGWLPMIAKFGGNPPAAWVRRHNPQGRASVQMDRWGNGYMEGANSVPYAGRWLGSQGERRATYIAQRDIAGQLEKRMPRIAEWANRNLRAEAVA